MELVVCLSEVIDLMSEEIRDHHKRVSCGAYQLAQACGISGEEKRDIVIAAALHDIGGLSLEARKTAALHFEDTNSHAEKGYKLLSGFKPFHNIANMVHYHHAKWDEGLNLDQEGQPISLASQIIFMADRIAVLLQPGILALTKSDEITDKIIKQSGRVYKPELVDSFKTLAPKDSFWLNCVSANFYESIMEELKLHDMVLSGSHMDAMLNLISNIIDFRSVFTTMHSKGVAIVAAKLAKIMGLNAADCYTISVAALLHDIGKLAIPTEILDKPGPLTDYERAIIRTHSYYTDHVLASVSGFAKVQLWAASHHECLNGKGYPHGYCDEDLSLGAKIMKVADIFVALTEDRPYRKGVSTPEAFNILDNMVRTREIDADVTSNLKNNIKTIEEMLYNTELKAAQAYSKFAENSL